MLHIWPIAQTFLSSPKSHTSTKRWGPSVFDLLVLMVVSTQLKHMLVKLYHFPIYRGKNKKYVKPPGSCFDAWNNESTVIIRIDSYQIDSNC